MNVYLIQRTDVWYDENEAHVIVANSVKECREMAKKIEGDEGSADWDTCPVNKVSDYTGKRKNSFMVLTSFVSA